MDGDNGNRIVLGTVQFGMPYGIANRTGCPSDEELRSILRTAWEGGIRHLDTARGYGKSEERLGSLLAGEHHNGWRVATKTAGLERFRQEQGCASFADAAAMSLRNSLEALHRDRVDFVLIHSFADTRLEGVLDRLGLERERGRFDELGVSVYQPDEALECLADQRIRHLQLPLNFLDRRWFGGAFERALARHDEVTIHVRSSFLQGLLLNGPDVWPDWVGEAGEIDSILSAASRGLQGGRIELCLRYVASVPWVDRIVIGVDSAAQLSQILSARLSEPLPPELLGRLDQAAELAPQRLLNPSLW